MNDATETVKTVTEYRLHVAGIWGRNRKAKNTSVVLAETDPTVKLDTAALLPLVNAKAAEMKVRGGSRLTVIATEVTIEECGVFTSRSFMMFSGKNVFEMGV